jgi:phage terminase large subunit
VLKLKQINAQIKMPAKLAKLFAKERGSVRYRCMYGGRGSGKSFNAAKAAAVFGYREHLRILCTRELQVSIKESFFSEVKNAIESEPFLKNHYTVGTNFIRGKNGTEFIFAGLRHNIASIKSMAQIDLCIVEEAETIPESSYRSLIPTIRAPKSEIWVLWNPCTENSPTDKRFRKKIDEDMLVCELNYTDNPYFPETLEAERQRDQRNLDDYVYRHIWEGAYLEISDAQVLRDKYEIKIFTTNDTWNGPYFGCDWGFSVDPTAIVKAWIKDNCLYIEAELHKVGVEIDHLPKFFEQLAGIKKYVIYADSARPETISYMRRQGFNIKPAPKGKDSVIDGIAHLRSYQKIIIHPNCKHFINEARTYSYKTDKLSGDVLPEIIDANNHLIDALRYALSPIIKNGSSGNSLTTQQSINNQW